MSVDDRIRDSLPELEWVFSIDAPQAGCLDLHAELDQQSSQFDSIDTAAEDPALLIYTSW